MEKLSKVSASQINKSLSVIEAFRRIDSNMPIAQVAFFLNAAKNEGLSLTDLADMSGILLANASRYIVTLSNGKLGEKGLDLLDYYENPVNRRQKLVVLTEKGRKLIAQLT